MKRFLFSLIIFCSSAAHLYAGISPRELSQGVLDYVHQELKARNIVSNGEQTVSVKIMGVDPRLRLSRCDVPLRMSAKSDRWIGRINTRVECRGASPWSIYVASQVRLTRQIVVANRGLARGTILSQADVRRMSLDVTDYPRGYFTRPAELIGKELRRAVATNNPISPAHVREALTIKRGDEVTIVASTKSLTIRSVGIALNDGRRGQQIRVKNRASKRVVKARVLQKGLVKVLI